jgi:hypothetical protein
MPKTELLQGTLDLLILKILTLGPNHGWQPVGQFALSMKRVLDAK